MKTRLDPNGIYVVSLERGDDLRACVEKFALDQDIVGGRVTAIGGLEDAELGAFVLATKQYVRKSFPGILELVSLDGNLTIKEGKPFLHVHAVISGEDFVAHAGHLFDAKVGLVVEMFIDPLSAPLARLQCDEIGLARWEPNGAPQT